MRLSRLGTTFVVLALVVFGRTDVSAQKNTPGSAGAGITFVFTGGTQTFTVPSGVHLILVEAWGGGGGGGASVPGSSGGGGGGGGYARAVLPVTPGNTFPVLVGGGGGTFPNASGGFGGDPGQDGTGGGGGGGGATYVSNPPGGAFVQACGGAGGAFNTGSGLTGGAEGGGGSVCAGLTGGQGASGFLSGFAIPEGTVFRGSSGSSAPGLGGAGGNFQNGLFGTDRGTGVATGGLGQTAAGQPATSGGSGLVRITYY